MPERDGVLYPRSGTLGGCTAHHAMITIYPHDVDWSRIADITGDDSWRASNMRRYFERLERCEYVHRPWRLPGSHRLASLVGRFPRWSNRNRSRHGWDGWLGTSLPDAKLAVQDKQLVKVVIGAARATLQETISRPFRGSRTSTRFATRTTGASRRRGCSASGPLPSRSRAAAATAPASCSKRWPRTARGTSPSEPTRSLRASSSTTTSARSASTTSKARTLYRADPRANGAVGQERTGARLAGGDPRRRRLQHPAAA